MNRQSLAQVKQAAVLLAVLFLSTGFLAAEPLRCDMGGYQSQDGLTAAMDEGNLDVRWEGERGNRLRLVLGVDGGKPVIRQADAGSSTGAPATLARDLSPEFHVTTGVRRISQQQLNPIQALGQDVTPEVIEKEKWKVFWDAPLSVPGLEGVNTNLPRKESEIRRSAAAYNITGCEVRTDGARLVVSLDGLELGIFSGRLEFTVYRGANLVRQEAIAKTDEPSVAYKYRGGWRGLKVGDAERVIWRDTSRAWQKYEFGGSVNDDPVPLRARNRLAIVETGEGSIAFFPPPHKFFWAREIEINLGYVWYRKDDDESFSVGVRHGDHEEMFRPYGFSDNLWLRRVNQSRRFAEGNFAMYNAPPGTWQRMAVYFYLSPEGGRETQRRVLAFTHNDRYKPLPGYQVAISHFHTHFAEQLLDAGTFDWRPTWLPAFRGLGINIAMMSDFHGDGTPDDPGPLRVKDLDNYFKACRRHSDREFLLMPGEEPNAYVGGHYTLIFPRPVYWTKVRQEGQPFTEQHPQYGTVYHTGSATDLLAMLRREGGLVWQAHPRTKGSTPYPDEIRHTEHFQSDRYLGGAYQSLPADLSEKRICEARCLGTLDDMNNWAGPKYLFAEGDTYAKFPEDEIYGELIVNYIKVDPLPKFDEDWSPITKALRAGDFFVTTGEVLIRDFAVEGLGGRRKLIADVEWTFPLDFVEIVWGDGETIGRKEIAATELPPFGNHRFEIPIDTAGKKWVRFAAWDSAGNGALAQPVHF